MVPKTWPTRMREQLDAALPRRHLVQGCGSTVGKKWPAKNRRTMALGLEAVHLVDCGQTRCCAPWTWGTRAAAAEAAASVQRDAARCSAEAGGLRRVRRCEDARVRA